MIRTARLRLREFTLDDLDAWSRIVGDPATMVFWPRPLTPDEARSWIERALVSYREHGFGRWVVTPHDSDTVIGDCGLIRKTVDGDEVNDLGYILTKERWGEGYATEMAAAVRDYAFDTLGLATLHANMAFDHHASRWVAEKIGMTRLREFDNPANRGIRTLLYWMEQDKVRE